jgi:nitroreductase
MTTDRPSRTELLDAIGSAVLAPSIHNTQPWLFRLVDGGVEVFADWSRQLPVADPDGRAVRVSCGAAVLNLRLAIQHIGFTVARSRPTPSDEALYRAIPQRRSNRFPYLDTSVSAPERTALVRAAEAEGAWMSFVIGQPALEVVVELVRLAERTLTSDPNYRAELAAWSRVDPQSPDGVPRTAGGPAPEPHDLLVGRDFGGAARAPGREFEPEPFVAVVGTFVDSPTAEITAGQALQRVLLTATGYGLAASLTSQPIDVASVREQLRIGLHRHGPPQMVLRLGRGVPAPRTLRRSVNDVLLESG